MDRIGIAVAIFGGVAEDVEVAVAAHRRQRLGGRARRPGSTCVFVRHLSRSPHKMDATGPASFGRKCPRKEGEPAALASGESIWISRGFVWRAVREVRDAIGGPHEANMGAHTRMV